MKKKYVILSLALIFSLSACSSKPKQVAVSSNDDEYQRLILEQRELLKNNIISVAQQAYEVQKTIMQVNNAMALKSTDFSPDVMRHKEWQNTYIPVGMERNISIDWKAYPEELLKLLASASSYDIEFLGKPYPAKRIVNLDPAPRPIKKLIDDVELQSTGYISHIDIFEDSKLIKVYYELHN